MVGAGARGGCALGGCARGVRRGWRRRRRGWRLRGRGGRHDELVRDDVEQRVYEHGDPSDGRVPRQRGLHGERGVLRAARRPHVRGRGVFAGVVRDRQRLPGRRSAARVRDRRVLRRQAVCPGVQRGYGLCYWLRMHARQALCAAAVRRAGLPGELRLRAGLGPELHAALVLVRRGVRGDVCARKLPLGTGDVRAAEAVRRYRTGVPSSTHAGRPGARSREPSNAGMAARSARASSRSSDCATTTTR